MACLSEVGGCDLASGLYGCREDIPTQVFFLKVVDHGVVVDVFVRWVIDQLVVVLLESQCLIKHVILWFPARGDVHQIALLNFHFVE